MELNKISNDAFMEWVQTETSLPASDKDLMRLCYKEIECIQKNSRWLWGLTTKENNAIEGLAIKLAKILKRVFDQLFAVTKTRPMTPQEELTVAQVGERLENAYKLAGNNKAKVETIQEVANAKLRATVKAKQLEEREALKGKIEELEKWAKTSEHEDWRELPIVNWFAWTSEGAKLQVAKMRVQIATESMRDVLPYPDLLQPRMQELIKAKKELLSLLKPNTREHFTTGREIVELGFNITELEFNKAEAEIARSNAALKLKLGFLGGELKLSFPAG